MIEVSGADLAADLDGESLGERLLAPTRIYVRSVLPLTRALRVHALAHITGGGLTENLPRVLPTGTRARVDMQSWQRPAVFDWLQAQGGIAESRDAPHLQLRGRDGGLRRRGGCRHGAGAC